MKKKESSQLPKSNVVVKGVSDQAVHSTLGHKRRRFLLMAIVLITAAILVYVGYWLHRNNKLGPFSKANNSSPKSSGKNHQSSPQIKIYSVPPKDAPAKPPKPAATG